MLSAITYFVLFFESVAIFMSVFFMIQYIVIKKREYLFYAIYLVCLSLYYIVAIPDCFFGVHISDPAITAKYDLFKRPLQFLSSVCYTLFIMYYLGLEKVKSFLSKLFKALLIMYVLLAIVCLTLNHAGINYDRYYYVVSLFLFPLQLYVVIALFRRKLKYSNYVIWGSIITLVGSSLTLTYYIYLRKYDPGNPEANALSYWPVEVSILIDLFLFTIALQRKIADNEKSLIDAALQRQQAVLLERERIIADLHDDVGGGLSSIRMLSDLMAQQGLREQQDKYVSFGQKISFTAKDIAQRMHTIIWSLNAENDTIENFSEYVRQHGVSFFATTDIIFKFAGAEGTGRKKEISGVKRKNLFLIIKESLHNIAKHSGATEAGIYISQQNELIFIEIKDNGKGIKGSDDPSAIRFGNGLKNMRKRMEEIGGQLSFAPNGSNGTLIRINVTIN